MKFEFHKMMNESIRDTVQKTEQEMKDLGLYVCVRPVGFCRNESPNIEITSLGWHLGNIEDALLERLDVQPENERLRQEFKESALLHVDADKESAACYVDLYEVYVRNNYPEDYETLSKLADELEQKLNTFAAGKAKETVDHFYEDTRDVLRVDEFFQNVMDICADFSEEELSEFNDFYDYAVQKAARETLPQDFHPNIKGYTGRDLQEDVMEFRYPVFEKLLAKSEKVSWQEFPYGSYKKSCGTETATRPVGKVYVGGVRFDVTPQSIADYHFLEFSPHVPKEPADRPLRSRGIIVNGNNPLAYETFQQEAEHLMGTTILDCGISKDAVLGKNPCMTKKHTDTLFR